MKSNKIQSLPENLRKEADKILADKFKGEQKTTLSTASIKVAASMKDLADAFSQPVQNVEIDYTESENYAKFGAEVINTPTQKRESIDPMVLDYIRQACGAPVGCVCTVTIYFKPCGSFPSGYYQIIRNLQECMELQIYGGLTYPSEALNRIRGRLVEIRNYYHGDFYARFESVNYTSPTDAYGLYGVYEPEIM